MGTVDTGVDDGDLDASALGGVPGGGRVDLRQVPLAAQIRVIRHCRQGHAAVEFGELDVRVARQALDQLPLGHAGPQFDNPQVAFADAARLAAALFGHDAGEGAVGQAGACHHQDATLGEILGVGRWRGAGRRCLAAGQRSGHGQAGHTHPARQRRGLKP